MLPIEFTEVTITRTLFRSGDSEYAINGVPCRLLDIQELLSDSGVGRQQHVIICQGQIDAVLNARPEDRRAVIEEAAGVLKYRRRKEKSERRLAATEGNLTRLQDLLREVRRQLRPLERQAEAARRHGDVVAELTALRVYTAGPGARRPAHPTRAGRPRPGRAGRRGARPCASELAGLDSQVLATEAELSAMGGDDLGDDLARFEALFEQSRGLTAVLTERRRGVERARHASVDQGVVASLEAEAARLADELAEVEAEATRLAPEAEELARLEASLAADRLAFEEEWSSGVPAPSGAAAEVRGELAALRATAEQGRSEQERVRQRADALAERIERLALDAAELRTELGEAEAAELPLVEALDAAERRRAEAEVAVAAAEEAHRRAESERHAWQARVEALALALDEARSRAGTERLDGVEGVLGTLHDLVEVDPGWEGAFEAAAGEALAAVVVDGVDSGRRALAALSAESLSGAVLALGVRADPPRPPGRGEPVRAHVRGRVRGGRGAARRPARRGGAGRRRLGEAPSTWPSSTPEVVVVTPSATASAAPAGGSAPAGPGPPARRSRRPSAGATRPRPPPSSAAAAVGSGPGGAGRRPTRGDRALHVGSTRTTTTSPPRATSCSGSRPTDATPSPSPRRWRATSPSSPSARAASPPASPSWRPASRPWRPRTRELADSARRMAEARTRLEEQAAEVGARRSDLEVRSAGVAERRQFLTARLAEVEGRLEGAAAERAAAEQRRVELDRTQVALERLSALRRRPHHRGRGRAGGAARAAAPPVGGGPGGGRPPGRPAPPPGRRASGPWPRCGSGSSGPSWRRPRSTLRIEAAVEAMRRDLDVEPDAAIAADPPGAARRGRRRRPASGSSNGTCG